MQQQSMIQQPVQNNNNTQYPQSTIPRQISNENIPQIQNQIPQNPQVSRQVPDINEYNIQQLPIIIPPSVRRLSDNVRLNNQHRTQIPQRTRSIPQP
eukprot:UN18778